MKKLLFIIAAICCISCSSANTPLEEPEMDYIDRKATFAQLPGWKFRCKVMVESKTVQDYGGRIEFMKKMDNLLVEASKFFQVAGINDEDNHQVHFFMIEMQEFTGQSKPLMLMDNGATDTTCDFRIIVNGNTTEGDMSGGWMGNPYLNLGHDYKGLFYGYALNALVHELGHVRGVPDLYAAELKGENNPINGEGYEATRCIMNYPYGEDVWSDYAKMIINASANNKLCRMHYTFLAKKGTQAKVLKANGEIAEGAYIKFYPVYAYSGKVTDTPLYEGKVTNESNYIFPQDPFIVPGQDNKDNNITNYLVEVTYNDKVTYRWMPMYEAQYAASNGQDPYIYTIQLEE